MITFHKPSNQSAANNRRNTRKHIAATIKRLNKSKASFTKHPCLPKKTRAKLRKVYTNKLQGKQLRLYREERMIKRIVDCVMIKENKPEPLYRKSKKLIFVPYTGKKGVQLAEVRYTTPPPGSGFASTKDSSLPKVSVDGRSKRACKRPRSGEKRPFVTRNKRILKKIAEAS